MGDLGRSNRWSTVSRVDRSYRVGGHWLVVAFVLLGVPAAAQNGPFPYAHCTVPAGSLGLDTIDDGVSGNINRRQDFNPDFVFVDELGDVISLAVTDSEAFGRVDCGRAIRATTLTENGPRAVALIDGDASGDVDYTVTGSSRTAIYFGDGLGGSAGGGGQSVGVTDGTDLVVADVDADGVEEIVVGTLGGNSVEIARPGETRPPIQPLAVGARVKALNVADFDGDGRLDVVVLDRANQILLFIQNPMPPATPEPTPPVPSETRPDLFLPPVTIFNGGSDGMAQISDMAVADSPGIDGDSIPDLVIVGTDADQSQLVVLFGDRPGPGQYEVDAGEFLILTGATPNAVDVGDLDGDGFNDIAVVVEQRNLLELFAGNGTRVLSAYTPIELPEPDNLGRAPTLVLLADVDFDSELDVAVGRRNGDLEMYLTNLLPVSTFTPTSTLTPTIAPSLTPTPTSTSTPTDTPTLTPTPTNNPTRTQTPTVTTTPGLLEVQGDGCASIVEERDPLGAWPLGLALLGLLWMRRARLDS